MFEDQSGTTDMGEETDDLTVLESIRYFEDWSASLQGSQSIRN